MHLLTGYSQLDWTSRSGLECPSCPVEQLRGEECICFSRRGEVVCTTLHPPAPQKRKSGIRNPALLQCFGGRGVFHPCTPWCLIAIRAEAEILCIVDTGKLMWKTRGVPGGVCKLKVRIPWLSWGVWVENTAPFDKCFFRKPTKKALEGLNHFYNFFC